MVARFGSILGLVLLCAMVYAPGLAYLPVVDRDEARFAQASRQMIETGDSLNIRFQDQPRYKKPAGIYWLQVLSARVGGDDSTKPDIFWYRLPSALGVTLAVVLTFLFARRWCSDQEAWLAAALLAVSAVVVTEAHLATSDAALLAMVVLAQGILGIAYIERVKVTQLTWPMILLFWIALGAGTLIKGPIVPGVCLLTAVTLGVVDREWVWLRRLRPGVGVPVFLLIVVPWVWAVQRATDGAFLRDAIGDDFLGKVTSGRESHGGWPGYYLILIVLTFWPGSLFAGLAIGDAFRRRFRSLERFCLAWLIPFWIVLELVPTKLPHYLMPAYPALAILTARAIMAAASASGAPQSWRSIPARIGFVFWMLLTLALAGAVLAGTSYFSSTISSFAVLAGVVAGGGAVVVLVYAWRRRMYAAALVSVASAGLFFALLFGNVLPSWSGLWLTRGVAQVIDDYRGRYPDESISVIAFVGYHEPSAVFEFGTDVALVSPERAAEIVGARMEPGFIVVDDRLAERFNGVPNFEEVGAVRGFHYSKGQWVTLRVLVIRPMDSKNAPG